MADRLSGQALRVVEAVRAGRAFRRYREGWAAGPLVAPDSLVAELERRGLVRRAADGLAPGLSRTVRPAAVRDRPRSPIGQVVARDDAVPSRGLAASIPASDSRKPDAAESGAEAPSDGRLDAAPRPVSAPSSAEGRSTSPATRPSSPGQRPGPSGDGMGGEGTYTVQPSRPASAPVSRDSGGGTTASPPAAHPADRRTEPAPTNRLLTERALPQDGEERSRRRPAGTPRRARSVTVNLAESPLGWLKARGLVDDRQFEAGERLRGDWTIAGMAPRVTMRWDAAPFARTSRGSPEAIDPTLAQLSAKRRMEAGLEAVGAGLKEVLWRIVCAGEGMETAERALGWPARAGRVVLTLALDRLADFYRLP